MSTEKVKTPESVGTALKTIIVRLQKLKQDSKNDSNDVNKVKQEEIE